MKIQILTDQQNLIDGYEFVPIKDGEVDLTRFSNNECTEIIADNIIDQVPISHVANTIKFLIEKLRMGGKLVLGGTDLRLFCKHVTNQSIGPVDANHIISQCKSMTNLEEIATLVASAGLKIEATNINGIHFEIFCKRQ